MSVDHSRFAALSLAADALLSRRGILRPLALLPLLGAAYLLDDEVTQAGKRRRKARRKRTSARQPQARAGTNGASSQGGACAEPCPASQQCDVSSGSCVPDAARPAYSPGRLNAACDVCASGCPFTSVQAAVNAASPGALIHICPGTYTENITINNHVTLAGAGSGSGGGNTILSGNQNGTVVSVNGGPSVTLQNLRITNGAAIDGGGISNQGSLTVNSCVITSNSADQGAGIWNSGGLLTLHQSTVSNNFATNNEGGGIYNTGGGTLVVNNSQITGNSAGNAGGGLYNNSAEATLNASSISGNSAGTFQNPGQGGGIYNQVGTITLSQSSVTNNSPDNCDGEAVNGCSG